MQYFTLSFSWPISMSLWKGLLTNQGSKGFVNRKWTYLMNNAYLSVKNKLLFYQTNSWCSYHPQIFMYAGCGQTWPKVKHSLSQMCWMLDINVWKENPRKCHGKSRKYWKNVKKSWENVTREKYTPPPTATYQMVNKSIKTAASAENTVVFAALLMRSWIFWYVAIGEAAHFLDLTSYM